MEETVPEQKPVRTWHVKLRPQESRTTHEGVVITNRSDKHSILITIETPVGAGDKQTRSLGTNSNDHSAA